MPPGLDALKHIVVLMMENRSFDHMLGGLLKGRPADRRAAAATRANPTQPGPGEGLSRRRSIRASSTPTRPRFCSGQPADLQRRRRAPTCRDSSRATATARERRSTRATSCNTSAREAAGADDAGPSTRCSTGGLRRFPGRQSATAPSRTTGRRSATSAWSSSMPTRSSRASTNGWIGKGKHREDCITSIRSSSTMEIVNLLQNQPQLFATLRAVPR